MSVKINPSTKYVIHKDQVYLFSQLEKDGRLKSLNIKSGKFKKIIPDETTKVLDKDFKFHASGFAFKCTSLMLDPEIFHNKTKFIILNGIKDDHSEDCPEQINIPYPEAIIF